MPHVEDSRVRRVVEEYEIHPSTDEHLLPRAQRRA